MRSAELAPSSDQTEDAQTQEKEEATAKANEQERERSRAVGTDHGRASRRGPFHAVPTPALVSRPSRRVTGVSTDRETSEFKQFEDDPSLHFFFLSRVHLLLHRSFLLTWTQPQCPSIASLLVRDRRYSAPNFVFFLRLLLSRAILRSPFECVPRRECLHFTL